MKDQATYWVIGHRRRCVENTIATVNGGFKALKIKKISTVQRQPLLSSIQLFQMIIFSIIFVKKQLFIIEKLAEIRFKMMMTATDDNNNNKIWFGNHISDLFKH